MIKIKLKDGSIIEVEKGSTLLQVAEKHVERDGRPGVSQMGVAIDRGAADVHAHHRFIEGHEMLLAP